MNVCFLKDFGFDLCWGKRTPLSFRKVFQSNFSFPSSLKRLLTIANTRRITKKQNGDHKMIASCQHLRHNEPINKNFVGKTFCLEKYIKMINEEDVPDPLRILSQKMHRTKKNS